MDNVTKFKQFDFQSNTINEDERSIVIFASTNETDRYGDIIEPTAFDLEKIKTLPILFNHQSNNPIGKTLWAKIQNSGLLLKIYISNKTQLARDIWELVKEGIISFASVGFIPIEWEEIEDTFGYKFIKVDLIETSLTPTPANPGAIALALKSVQSPELKELFEYHEQIEKLKKEIEEKDEQLKEKDEQLKEKDELQTKLNIATDIINQYQEKETAKKKNINAEINKRINKIFDELQQMK